MAPLRFRAGRSPAGFAAVWCCLCFLIAAPASHAAAAAAVEWQVADAALRYKLDLRRSPTESSAGYYCHLPDGGILRGGAATTVVMTDAGKVVPSFLLWQNPESGFSFVFADPGSSVRSVYVYIQSARQPQVWKPDSGITPSAILCTLPGRDNLGAAHSLAQLGRVDPMVNSINKAGIPKAPFSIGGDESGRPRPGSFYLLSYIIAPTAGSYWFSPFIREGQCEILIDGVRLNVHEHSKQWGGDGAAVDLTKGLHRVEVFQTADGTGPYSSNKRNGGLMFLTWRPPKEQLKGVESRILKDAEIVRSGDCNLISVEAKNGAPVAVGLATPGLCYWFENEEPLIIYDLNAVTTGEPAGTTYTWTFPEGAVFTGPKTQWIFSGLRETKVQLTTKSSAGTSSSIIPFFTFSIQAANLDNFYDRTAFRKAVTTMLAAYPHTPDPVADWSSAWWNNLMRTIEADGGYPLLHQLFTNHFDTVRKKISPEQLSTLQDLLLDLMQRQDPREALQWIQTFYAAAPSVDNRNALKLREGEVQMYYLGDRNTAKQIFTTLSTTPGELGERAKIRLGDLAFLDGDLNGATAIYADVQKRARNMRNAAPAVDKLVTNQLVNGNGGNAKPAASPDWRSAPLPMQGAAAGTAPGTDLKHGALQEVSLSENVHTLTEGNFFLEALQALSVWESEFPLSKISGDYIIRESALYIKMQDWKRAQPMLEAYCREIDASSFLPDAASMLIECVQGAKEPPASIRDIIVKVRDRLKFHPVAADLDRFLSGSTKPSP